MAIRIVVHEEPAESRVHGRIRQVVALEGGLGELRARVFAHLGHRQGVASAQVEVGRGREGSVDLEAVRVNRADLADHALPFGVRAELLHDVGLLDVEAGQLKSQQSAEARVDTGLILHAALGVVDLSGGVRRDGAALVV